MKKMADIMEELGFRPEASDEVKKAFIKNLIKEAQKSEFSRPQAQQPKAPSKDKRDADNYEQISLFDLGDQKISS